MQFDKFTIKSQEALSAAQSLASENGHQSIKDIHMMSAMLEQKEGIIIPILQKLEINVDDFRAKVTNLVKNVPKVSGGTEQIYISNELNGILNDSFKEACNRGHSCQDWCRKVPDNQEDCHGTEDLWQEGGGRPPSHAVW